MKLYKGHRVYIVPDSQVKWYNHKGEIEFLNSHVISPLYHSYDKIIPENYSDFKASMVNGIYTLFYTGVTEKFVSVAERDADKLIEEIPESIEFEGDCEKIAFCFLTIHNLKKGKIWFDFLNSGRNRCTMYSHSKHLNKIKQRFLLDSQIENRVDTQWGKISLVLAQNNMLREALKDKNNEYFMLVSDSCIPLYSFNFIYDEIVKTGKSWIFYYKLDHPQTLRRYNKLDFDISIEEFYKQSQFCLLKRKHVEFILQNDHIKDFASSEVPDEHYYINILKKKYSNFDKEFLNYPITYVNRSKTDYRNIKNDEGSTLPVSEMIVSEYQIKSPLEEYDPIITKYTKTEGVKHLFYRKVDYSTKITKKMNKEIALKNLKDLDSIFRKNKTEYWLSCGTLLGFYRDGDFIGHDSDTDVCVNIDHLNMGLLDDLIKEKFTIGTVFGRIEDGFEIALHREGVKTDLFFFYKKEKYWYHSVYSNFTSVDNLKHDYVFEPFDLSEKEYLGHKFIVPSDIESVLVQQYGEDWKTPVKNWLWYSSPKNIVHTGKRVLKADTIADFQKLFRKND